MKLFDRQKKWEINLYSYYDHAGIVRHLEDMARQGWQLEKAGSVFWTYRRCKPAELRYAVVYFSKASQFDPEPPAEQREFWELCKATGWELVTNRYQMQIFRNPAPDAIPIETDPVVQVENVRAAMKKGAVRGNWVLLICSCLQIWLQFRTYSIRDFLTQGFALSAVLIWLLLGINAIVELIGYYRWRRRAVRNARELGRFTPTRSLPGVQLLTWLLLALITLSALTDSWAVLRRMNASATVNRTVTIIVDILVVLVLFVVFLPRLAQEPPPPNAEPYEYTYLSMDGEKTATEYAYHDPLPLYVEDLTETDYDRYSCKREDSSTPLVRKQTFSQQMRWGERGADAPTLRCTIYDIRLALLFAPCLQGKLNEYADRKWSMMDYREADAAPWGADRAWQLWDTEDSTPRDSWLLVYGRRIVTLSARDIDMDGADMALVGERLGK